MDVQELAAVLDDLIEVLHSQARSLEKLVAHVEQVSGHLPEVGELSVVLSTLTGLHHRVKKLRGANPLS